MLIYKQIDEKIRHHNIEAKNIYNMDKKGFLISKLNKARRVFSLEPYKADRLAGAGQPGSREWIILLATIYQDLTFLPPSLIYKSEAGNIQDTWTTEFNPEEYECFFTASPTGWINKELSLAWLDRVFNRYTKAKARHRRDPRLLIIDGHSSHINISFINYCERHNIHIGVFPLHSMHRL